MKAVQIHSRGGIEKLVYEDTAEQPHPKDGEVLVCVHATSVTPTELEWSTNWENEDGSSRSFPVIPGHDFSGAVAEIGSDVSGVTVGTEVYGLTDFTRNGAEAEYTIALPSEIAPKPRSLNSVQAAAVPLSGLTAWQALFDHAQLTKGQAVLIHGGAGGVGSFAVQFAKWAGAHVIAVASAHNKDFLREIGADEIIDYKVTRFEDVVRNADVVFDTVGGEVLDRSWSVVRRGGILVSVVAVPSPEKASSLRVKGAFFIVEPNKTELIQIGELIDLGRVKPIIENVFPLEEARRAYEKGQSGHNRGKMVLQVINPC